MLRSSSNRQRQTTVDVGDFAAKGSGFRYLKSECPICNGARKKQDCRESRLTGLIHCMAGLSAPSGWRETGVDSQGFVMYAAGEGQTDPREFERRRLEREQRQQQQARRTAESLPNHERDRQFRQVAKHSGLSTKHRQNLLNRDYTADQIERAYSHKVCSGLGLMGRLSLVFRLTCLVRMHRGTSVTWAAGWRSGL